MGAGDAAWMFTATALVLFMVPGLAIFYGGMLRSKNILNMIMMNMYCLGAVTVGWVLIGYTLGNTGTGGPIGNLDNFGLKDIHSLDAIVKVAFLMTFAVITPALISGAVADRMKFSAWAIFVPVWSILVYCPITYWMYVGWMAKWGVLDFAGGTTIHINAGVASLALILVLGKRSGWPAQPMLPHNLVLVVIGAGILWFGWFGFNAGSAGAANEQAGRALLNTFIAGAAGMLGWMFIERVRGGKVTTLGAVSGVVAGLACITPAAGFVGGLSPLLFGLISAIACYGAIQLKTRFGYDDSLDVVGVHMVAGLIGGLLLGLFADNDVYTAEFLDERFAGGPFQEGALFGGGWGGGALIWDQLVAMAVVLAYSFVVTFVIAKALAMTIGLRASAEAEQTGLDLDQHAERAYAEVA